MVGRIRIGRNGWRTAASLAVLAAVGVGMPGHALAQDVVAEPMAAEGVQAPAARFDIRAFQVKGNTILPPAAVERAVYPFMGPGRGEADVEAARAALQKAFEDAGYVAVSVFVPEQSVDGGILQLEVQPQAIGQVVVEGASKPEAVKAQAPSLAVGKSPNINDFQRDVVAMNAKPSRRVTPELKAGVAPGTLDVVLTVEETTPFHVSVEYNNFSSAATTDLRAMGTVRYDDMWGRGDSLSLSVQTAPRRTDDAKVFSGNYMMRLGQKTQLLLYAVHSDSDIAVVGGTSVVGKGNLFGARLIRSLGGREGFYHALTLGIDWKDFTEDVRLGADRASAPIAYFPVTASWRGDWSSDTQRSDLSLSAVMGLRGLGDGWQRFDAKRYKAQPSFLTFKLDAGRTQELEDGFQLDARLTGQWSPDPLISNEGFSIGGMQSVRGYFESEALADWGLAYQVELRTPDLGPGGLVNELRLHSFVDLGLGGLHDPLPGQKHRFRMGSMGVGGRVKLLDYLNGAIDIGTPLISGPDSKSGDIFARFRIWGEF